MILFAPAHTAVLFSLQAFHTADDTFEIVPNSHRFVLSVFQNNVSLDYRVFEWANDCKPLIDADFKRAV